jgi:hypothetical protein
MDSLARTALAAVLHAPSTTRVAVDHCIALALVGTSARQVLRDAAVLPWNACAGAVSNVPLRLTSHTQKRSLSLGRHAASALDAEHEPRNARSAALAVAIATVLVGRLVA